MPPIQPKANYLSWYAVYYQDGWRYVLEYANRATYMEPKQFASWQQAFQFMQTEGFTNYAIIEPLSSQATVFGNQNYKHEINSETTEED